MRNLIVLMLLSVVGACAHGQGPQNEGCGGFRPVYPSEREVALLSQKTVDGLLGNLETGRVECGWKPPAPKRKPKRTLGTT